MKKVLVFGTFDRLHNGHLNFLRQAKKYGNYLTIVVARDSTVKRLKKHLPFQKEKTRLKTLQKSKLADEVLLGNKNNPFKIIKKIEPDIICLGYDQKTFTAELPEELKRMDLKTKIIRLKPYRPRKYHSSIINPAK